MLGLQVEEEELLEKQNNPIPRCIGFFSFVYETPCSILRVETDFRSIFNSDDLVEVVIFWSVGNICFTHHYIGWITAKKKIDCSIEDLLQKKN
jgi:hypothetical protein